MKTARYTTAPAPAAPAAPSAPAAPEPAGLANGWVRFWFTPTDPIGLHALRILAGLLFLCWLLPFAGHLDSLFGLQGWFDRQAYTEAGRMLADAEAGRIPQGPPRPITWSMLYLVGRNSSALAGMYWGSLLILVLFTLGVWPRLTAVLTWLIVCSFTANPAIETDADPLLPLLAFYLMVGYVLLGQWSGRLSWVGRLLGPTWPWRRSGQHIASSTGANLALRLLQVHFAMVMVLSGLHKLQFGEWWSGVAFWYPLHPPFSTTAEKARAWGTHAEFYMFVLSAAAYATLAWQIAFPAFAWRRRWRILLLGGGLLGCLACALLYRLPLFGPIVLLGCLSYLTAQEWRRLLSWLPRLPALPPRGTPATTRKETPSLVLPGQR